ncbi:uncharacterized protein EAE98_000412 [Botrytis deweyae]|uniref:CST complex subunit Stn1 N-terminal domain-containing protein n=1 Tax=Botrytis deweyae TaxID=2478750 RepID=A0ABQ7J2N0_9HELO|nr:uncharacterized protein EAE98_000412 [Botrytis deweyae]KAF7940285.1 hypothetical protein EAE98_000412 [Botrytis deweyae]
MDNLFIKEGTAKQVDVKYEDNVNLPADTPSGHPHIIKWNAGVDKDKIPNDLLTVDVIATILYKFNPLALSHLLDIQAGHFICWWDTNGHMKLSENDQEHQNGMVDSESDKSDNLSPDYICLLRAGNIVRVGITSFASHCSDLDVTYVICEKGNWEIICSEDRSHDEKDYPYTSSMERREAHDHKLARMIIRGTDFEGKKNMPMSFHSKCVSITGRVTEVSQQVQEAVTGSGGSSRFVGEMSEVQGRLDKLQKSVEEVKRSLKRKRND